MNLIEQIKRHEGLRLKPYQCSAGMTTIGFGRNLQVRGISYEEAEHLLMNDVEDCYKQVNKFLPWASNLSMPRYAVLINMCFNLGINGLLMFHKTLKHLERSEYIEASLEMLKSTWAKQVGKRAAELSQQILTGEWSKEE